MTNTTLLPVTTHSHGTKTLVAGGVTIAFNEHMAWLLTECCQASAKGSEFGIVCRSCYGEVDPGFGDAAAIDEADLRRLAANALSFGWESPSEVERDSLLDAIVGTITQG